MINLRVGDKVDGQVIKSLPRTGFVCDINAASEALLPLEHFPKKQPKLRVGDQVQDLTVIDVDHEGRGYAKIILSAKDMVRFRPNPSLMSPERQYSPLMSPGNGTPPEYESRGVRASPPPFPGVGVAVTPSRQLPPSSGPFSKLLGGTRPAEARGTQSPASQASEDDMTWAQVARMSLSREEQQALESRPQAAQASTGPTANAKIARAREAEEQRSAEWRPAPPDFLLSARRGGNPKPEAPSSPKLGPMEDGRGPAGARRQQQRGWEDDEPDEEYHMQMRPATAPAIPSGSTPAQGRRSPPQSPPNLEGQEERVRRRPQTRGSPPGSPELMSENDLETVGIGRYGYYTDHLDFDPHHGASRPPSNRPYGGQRPSMRVPAPHRSRRSEDPRGYSKGSATSSALNSPQGGSSPRGSYEGVPYPAGNGVQSPVDSRVVRELRLVLLETAREMGFPTALLGTVLKSLDCLQDLDEPLQQKQQQGASPSLQGGHRSTRDREAGQVRRSAAAAARADTAYAAASTSRPTSAGSRASRPPGSPQLQARDSRTSRSSAAATGTGRVAHAASSTTGTSTSPRGSTPAPSRISSAPGNLAGTAPAGTRQRTQHLQPAQGRAGLTARGTRRSSGDGSSLQEGTDAVAKARSSTASKQRAGGGGEEHLDHLDSITNPSGMPVKDLVVGQEANGTVVDIVPSMGIFFDIGAQKYGRLPKRHMGRDLPEDLRVGDVVEGLRIDRVDVANQRFTLSGEGLEFGEPIYLGEADSHRQPKDRH